MEKKTIISNENISDNLKELKNMCYQYIIKANDKFMSDWGCASGKKHVQLIACATPTERDTIMQDLRTDKYFNYINWYFIDDTKGIYNTIRHNSYTIRNDWTRCF